MIDGLYDAALDDDIRAANALLGDIGLIVGPGDVEAGDHPDIWARVVENTSLDDWTHECSWRREVRARKAHDCFHWPFHGNFPPRGNSAIKTGDTYHVYRVQGMLGCGMVKVCAECVDNYDLAAANVVSELQ